MSDLLHTNDRIKFAAVDAYQAVDELIRKATADEDDPKHEEIVIEGENLMETLQGFLETLGQAGEE
jgi:hypothetical protein